MTEAKAIRNSVEGRDVPRGPSATELHKRTLIVRSGVVTVELRAAVAHLGARGWRPEPRGDSVFEDGAA